MVMFDWKACNGCGLCARICHEHCLTVDVKSIRIDFRSCSACGQCIAVCPSRALTWDGVAPVPFDDTKLPSADELDQLFGQRRTIREFKAQKLDRPLIGEIVASGIYAPTHNFALRAIAVDDEALIDEVDEAVHRFSSKVYYWIYKNPVTAGLARLAGPALRTEFIRAKPKLECSLKLGRTYASKPPALIFVVGDNKVPLSLESAQYALYTMNLSAMARGIGCRNLVGNQMVLNRDRRLRRKLGIGRGERIFAMMALGRPAVRFSNIVRGKTMALSWNGSENGRRIGRG